MYEWLFMVVKPFLALPVLTFTYLSYPYLYCVNQKVPKVLENATSLFTCMRPGVQLHGAWEASRSPLSRAKMLLARHCNVLLRFHSDLIGGDL